MRSPLLRLKKVYHLKTVLERNSISRSPIRDLRYILVMQVVQQKIRMK